MSPNIPPRNDHDELNRLVNTAMFGYSGIGISALIITVLATYYVHSIFRIPTDFVATARWLLLIVGTSVSRDFRLVSSVAFWKACSASIF